ncbi:MAG: hypothetical protein J0H25_08920 [Rhizobiales bacterium]|nr:hypothetical protein [Hyphomicrobiales bacterium]
MMRLRTSVLVAAALLGLGLAVPQSAEAMVVNPGVSAPSVVDTVACRTVRSRIVRPGGRVVYKTTRQCTPHWSHHRRGCVMERQRIVRPNGAVVYKQVRRCR